MPRLPTVTAIMPAYNGERFIVEAIDSFFAQDYPAGLLDLVVVDDGSTDGTAAIVAQYSAREPGRVTLIRQDNRGNVGAMNTAFAAARGEHVAILDADDAWPADRVRRHVEVLEARPEVVLVYGDMRLIDEHGETLKASWHDFICPGEPPTGRCFARLLVSNAATSSAVTLRGSAARAITPIPPGIPAADWWLSVRAAQVGELAYVREPRTLYRFHGGNWGLGAEGLELRASLQRRMTLQRWYMRRMAPGAATAAEVAAIWEAFEHNAREVVRLGGTALRPILEVTDAERAAAVDLFDQARAESGAEALATLVRAAATDPFNAPAREALATAAA